MKYIDQARLDGDIHYRFTYLTDFIGFGDEDQKAIYEIRHDLFLLVPKLVDGIYEKLFEYDCTKKYFMPKQHKYEGEIPTTLEELTTDHPVMKFRKIHLSEYLKRLIAGQFDDKTIKYLDKVGKIHSSHFGNKSIYISPVHIHGLMSFISDSFHCEIFNLSIGLYKKQAAVRALNKLLWVQNDLIMYYHLASPK